MNALAVLVLWFLSPVPAQGRACEGVGHHHFRKAGSGCRADERPSPAPLLVCASHGSQSQRGQGRRRPRNAWFEEDEDEVSPSEALPTRLASVPTPLTHLSRFGAAAAGPGALPLAGMRSPLRC